MARFFMADTTDKPRRYTGAPMDLANMRANGVRSLLAICLDCSHEATVNVDHLAGTPCGAVIVSPDEVQQVRQ